MTAVNDSDLPVNTPDLVAEAIEFEQKEEFEKAIKSYQKYISAHPHDEKSWSRVIILFRKLKDKKNELKTLKEAIKEFENYYTKPKSHGRKVKTLSQALLKATGLVNKKGESGFQPGPLAKWKRRKESLEKSMQKKGMTK